MGCDSAGSRDYCTVGERKKKLQNAYSIKKKFFPRFNRWFNVSSSILSNFTESTRCFQNRKLLDAVCLVHFSWIQVSENTIKNCFCKAGWGNLKSQVFFKEYAELCKAVVFCKTLNLEDIVASV